MKYAARSSIGTGGMVRGLDDRRAVVYDSAREYDAAAQGASPIGSDPHGSASAVDPPDPVAETHIDTTGYSPDQSESRALTDYLTQHRLPLVGAQVLNGPDGKRAIVLSLWLRGL